MSESKGVIKDGSSIDWTDTAFCLGFKRDSGIWLDLLQLKKGLEGIVSVFRPVGACSWCQVHTNSFCIGSAMALRGWGDQIKIRIVSLSVPSGLLAGTEEEKISDKRSHRKTKQKKKKPKWCLYHLTFLPFN